VAGRIYSWNTLGSLAGAVLGGYALLFWLDLHHVYRIAVGALAIGAAILSARVLGVPRAAAALAAALACALLGFAYGPWDGMRLSSGLFRQRQPLQRSFSGPSAFFAEHLEPARLLMHRDDPTTTVTVKEFERPTGTSRAVITNGKSDGDTVGDYTTMALAALLPALLAENHERAFVIGWGLGITVGELGRLDGTREILAAEISRGVIEAAPLFDAANQRASWNPKVRITRSDAYRALLRSEGRFDLIASEPSNPWVTGVEMLYSKEFLSAARDRLAPGGVYAQWFHLYETDRAVVELVLRTYRSVFQHVSVWYTKGEDLLLLGFRAPERMPDLEALRRRFAQRDFAAGFARSGVPSFEALLAHEVLPLGVLAVAELAGPIHTLRHPILSDRAARAFFRGGVAELPRFASLASAEAGARNSLLRRTGEVDGGPLPEELAVRLAGEACRRGRGVECATFLARGLGDHPESARLQSLLEEERRRPETLAALDPATLERLMELFGSRELPPPGRDGGLAAAVSLSDAYRRFFHYAVPFDRGVVERAWRRCGADSEACRAGRAQTERQLGLGAGALGSPAG
jgi:spermidine synthase